MKDGWGILLSFGYVIFILILAKRIEKKRWASPFVARKWVHLAVGSWVLPTFFLFDWWFMAIVPPFCFIWANLYLERKRFFSFGSEEGGYGTIYFPISFVLLLTFFWSPSLRVYACLGVLAMAWGDSLAAVVGKKWGHHHYAIGRTLKSFEGSLAMLGGTFVACWVSFLLFQPGSFKTMAIQSGVLAVVATLLESFSVRGLDNLTVPLGTAWIGVLLFSGL